MKETAARSEPVVRSGFSGPCYTWEVPGKPVSVAIPLAMMDRLEHETVLSFRSLSSRGSEIGGVLFGTTAPGKPALVTIASYEPVPCDYSLGPLYHLSGSDLSQMDRIIAQAKSAGMIPVGFFRSHTRKGLALDAEDRKLLDLRFADPHCIALLIRPFASKASAAGIFIWEDGDVRSETSYLEFPFRSSHCMTAVRPAPPPAGRAQIVPIASRREPILADLPLTVAVPGPELEVLMALPDLPAARDPEIAHPAAPHQVAPHPAAPHLAAVPDPVAAPDPASVTVAVPMADEPVLEQPAPETVKRSKRIYTYIAAGALAAALVLLAYFGGVRRGGSAIPAQDAGLALRVERSAGELLLTWNRDSAAIRNASRAVLEIADGTQHENVEMDLAQLRNGTIIYSPVTADVVFRMDVTGKDQKQLASESVRVLRTRPSPLATETVQPLPGAAAVPDKAGEAAVEPEPEEEAKPAGPPRVTKPFNTESLSHRLRPATATDILDAPAVAREAAAVPSMPLGLTSAGSAALAPPPAPATPEKLATPLGGQIETARLISKKDPEYSKMARDAGAKGVVKLVATVGADGRVLKVRPVSGHPLLIRPATEAVMQWIYRPTYLNGIPVETQTDIQLNFVNDK